LPNLSTAIEPTFSGKRLIPTWKRKSGNSNKSAGLAEADAGQVIDHRKVKAMAARWKRHK
jgi:hypothetical protein